MGVTHGDWAFERYPVSWNGLILGREPEFGLQYMTSSFDDSAQISSPEHEEFVASNAGTQDMARGIRKANELLVFCLMDGCQGVHATASACRDWLGHSVPGR